MRKVMIQIGTNNGNDKFLRRVKQEVPDLVILVEPNILWRDTIKENYKNISGAIILNVAITDKSGDIAKLVIPKGRPEMYNSGNFSLLPMDDWGDDFETIEAPTLSFSDMCDKYSIIDIDVLCIDTEGYDAQIIKTIDFNKYNIKEIEYEYWGFPEECFTRYGEAKKHYGISGMQEITQLLIEAGYTITNSPFDTLNRIAKKNE